jgi:hypothetical protein
MADQSGLMAYEGERLSSRTLRDPGLGGDNIFLATGDVSDQFPKKADPLDSADAMAMHTNLLGNHTRELEKQAQWRRDMERDENIYDSLEHWDPMDEAILEERGQVPIVLNVTATAVNWILGSQRKTPRDYKVLPRKKDGLKHAERKTQIFKYLSDVCDTPFQVSLAFAEQVKAGLGWLESGVQAEDDGEPIYERMETWRSIIYDSSAREWDLSDARYMFRTRWMDLDSAFAMFPKRGHVLRLASTSIYDSGASHGQTSPHGDSAMDSHEDANDYGYFISGFSTPDRPRVRIWESWFKRPVQSKYIKGGQFSGEMFDPNHKGHRREAMGERCEIVSKTKERMFCALFTESGMLWLSRSPYRHNHFPWTPIWGYRRAKDGAPYGMIRNVRDIQIDLNKRASKALWHLTAKRAVMSRGAVKDLEQFREEMTRPDAILLYEEGHAAPAIETDLQHASAQMEYMSQNIRMIQQTSGITDENMGRESNATSGKAILARQDQGMLSTNVFFENLRFARKKHGEKMLALIEQFMGDEKEFRVTNLRGNPEYVNLNDPTDDDSQITLTKADFVISEIDYNASHRQLNMQALMELASSIASTNPMVIPAILDLLVEAMDIPNHEEIVKRIRQITGMADPDEDPNSPSPETAQAMAAKAEQDAMQKRGVEAQIAGAEAKARSEAAKATKTEAEAAGLALEQQNVALTNFGKAIETAVQMAGLPAVARAAEKVMEAARLAAMEAGEPMDDPMMMPEAPMPMPQDDPMQQQMPPQPDQMSPPIPVGV